MSVLRSPSIKEAASILLKYSKGPEKCESLFLGSCLNRVSSKTYKAAFPVPSFSKSAYDGYAVRSEDTSNASDLHPVTLKTVSTLTAGACLRKALLPGQAVRIMTGAPVPEGADSIIKFESTREIHDPVPSIVITDPTSPGCNVIQKGEDLMPGQMLADLGVLLTPGRLGLLASQGIAYVQVYEKPTAVILSTGDELVMPQESIHPLKTGQIYNSGSFAIAGWLEKIGFNVLSILTCPDDKTQLTEKMIELTSSCDLLVTTGGVSVGDKDYLSSAVKSSGGTILFSTIDMKPGYRTLAAAFPPGRALLLGLSGNPGAALTVLLSTALPCLFSFCGRSAPALHEIDAILKSGFHKSSPRTRLLHGRLENEKGLCFFGYMDSQRNGTIRGFEDFDSFAVIPAGSGPLIAGSHIKVLHIQL